MSTKTNYEKISIETFGGPLVLTGRIVGGYKHGFDSSSGSWCLSDGGGGDHTYTQAYFILFVEKGKRKAMTINANRIIECKGGDEMKVLGGNAWSWQDI